MQGKFIDELDKRNYEEAVINVKIEGFKYKNEAELKLSVENLIKCLNTTLNSLNEYKKLLNVKIKNDYFVCYNVESVYEKIKEIDRLMLNVVCLYDREEFLEKLKNTD